MRHSLDNRTNSNKEFANGQKNDHQYTGLRMKSEVAKGVMDISFTSDEDGVTSEKYYDTVKGLKSKPRTLEVSIVEPENKQQNYKQLRNTRGVS